MLTEKQMYLMKCLKAYGLEQDEGCGTLILLKTEEQQDKMLKWMKSHTTASQEEVLKNALRIAELI